MRLKDLANKSKPHFPSSIETAGRSFLRYFLAFFIPSELHIFTGNAGEFRGTFLENSLNYVMR